MLRTLLVLLLLVPSGAARAQFPNQPPCGSAFAFEPVFTAGGTVLQYDQVTVPGRPAPAGAFTLEAWVKYHAAEGSVMWPDGFHTIVAFGEVNAGSKPLLNVRFGELELWDGGSRVRGGTLPLNQWAHVAYTWDGTTNRLYVNGVETASSTNTPTFDGANFYVGYSRGNTGWRGLIDEVMIWNEARTAEQIATDALGVRANAEPSLYAYFKFDVVYYDLFTGAAFALNESNPEVRGALGWTQDYPTGAPDRIRVLTPEPEDAEVLSCRLRTPLGLAIDGNGTVLISEVGTGNDDGQLFGYLPDASEEPFPQFANLTSAMSPEGMPAGTNQIGVTAENYVLIMQGEGPGPLARKLVVVETARGNTAPPVATYDVGSFLLGQGFAESNPYAVVVGPGDDYFVLDAAANAMVRIDDATGAMSVFATFDPIENTTPVGPPLIDAVPTGIAFDGTRFYVTAFTGFPFLNGRALLHTVSLTGEVQPYRGGTSFIDVDLDPRDDRPVVLEFAQTGAPGEFLPGTGRIVKYYPGFADTLATGLTQPTALAHAADGTLYVTTLEGQLLRYEAGSALPTDGPVEVPSRVHLDPVYPNPFNPSASVRFTLRETQPMRLAAYDLLGREVAVLATGVHPAGTHTFTWDAADLASGVYLLRLATPTEAATQRAVLLK